MRVNESAIISMMNAAMIDQKPQLLAESIISYCEQNRQFNDMLANDYSEKAKGALLAKIRKSNQCAELHYLLLMLYAAKFDDIEIYRQAVIGMKTAFSAEKKNFYDYNEKRIASGGGMNTENRVELLGVKDLPRIKMNYNKLLLQAGCCGDQKSIQAFKTIAFRIMRDQVGAAHASKLTGLGADEDSLLEKNIHELLASKRKDISAYFFDIIYASLVHEIPEVANPSINRWLKLMTMKKIKETPLRDFFTGDLYKPPFLFNTMEENNKNGIFTIKWLKQELDGKIGMTTDGKPIARVIFKRFSEGHRDWNSFFKMALKSSDHTVQAKSQRLLLLMVAEFGPHSVFSSYIYPAVIHTKPGEKWDIYKLTMYCDLYRLHLAYKKPINEQHLFNMLVRQMPPPKNNYRETIGVNYHYNIRSIREEKKEQEKKEEKPFDEEPQGWQEFKNSAEWIIMCLLLSSSPVRRFQLDRIASNTSKWMKYALSSKNYDMVAEVFTIAGFLSVGVLADLVPEKLALHQLVEKCKVLWMQHAFMQDKNITKSFRAWQVACGIK